MEKRFLGRTGLRVSPLCLGTMGFGGRADRQTSGRLYAMARDAGINIFDTADVYNGGDSERVLGELIKEHRDEVVVASKVYFPTSSDANARGLSRYHIVRAVEASLRRLKTEVIDIYYLHRFDEETDVEETLRAVEQLVRDGKILYPALSNFSAYQSVLFAERARARGWAQPVCVQPMYNLAKRQAESEILPMCASQGLGCMPYSPTGGGLLTGKYTTKVKPASGRLVANKMYSVRYSDEENFRIAERFSKLAHELGHQPAALALAWVAAHPSVTAPIIGANVEEHLKVALSAAKIDLRTDRESYERIAKVSYPPPPATDRNEESSDHNYGSR